MGRKVRRPEFTFRLNISGKRQVWTARNSRNASREMKHRLKKKSPWVISSFTHQFRRETKNLRNDNKTEPNRLLPT